MRRDLRARLDPIEHAIELALAPGTLIQDGECLAFVSGLEEVSAKIRDVIASKPARAVALYEAFLAGCAAKADELDDIAPRPVGRGGTGEIRPKRKEIGPRV